MTTASQSGAGLLHFNGEVNFGDLLTSASVLLAAITLSWSFWQARRQERRALADAIRTAAADALAKIDRYARWPLALTEKSQVLAVEVSQKVAASGAQDDIKRARDDLWEGLSKNWQEIRAAQRDESIELVHVRLLGS